MFLFSHVELVQDPNKCIATEKEILSILPIKDLQQCENRFVDSCDNVHLMFFPHEQTLELTVHSSSFPLSLVILRLVQVLQYENFEFTKLLLKNRLKILCAAVLFLLFCF